MQKQFKKPKFQNRTKSQHTRHPIQSKSTTKRHFFKSITNLLSFRTTPIENKIDSTSTKPIRQQYNPNPTSKRLHDSIIVPIISSYPFLYSSEPITDDSRFIDNYSNTNDDQTEQLQLSRGQRLTIQHTRKSIHDTNLIRSTFNNDTNSHPHQYTSEQQQDPIQFTTLKTFPQITHIPSTESLFDKHNTTIESYASYHLPIIRVGATAFGLLQVQHASNNTAHLRLLGGANNTLPNMTSTNDTTTTTTNSTTTTSQSTNNSNLHHSSYLSSIITASAHTHIQTGHQFSQSLSFLNEIYQTQRTSVINHYRQHNPDHINYTDDELASLLLHDVPMFLEIKDVNDDGIQYNMNQQRNNFLIENAHKSTSTLGRVIATHLYQRQYPADPPYTHYSQSNQNKNEKIKIKKMTQPHALHLIDMGSILPLNQHSFDTSLLSSHLSSTLMYPNLFEQHFNLYEKTSSTLLAQLSSLLMSSHTLYPIVKRNYQYYFKQQLLNKNVNYGGNLINNNYDNNINPHKIYHNEYEIRSHTKLQYPSPYPTSLQPWFSTIQSILQLEQFHGQNPLDMNIAKNYIRDEFWVQSPLQLQLEMKKLFTLNTNKNIKDNTINELLHTIDPQLLLWLLPLLYHFNHPNSPHPNAYGEKLFYHTTNSLLQNKMNKNINNNNNNIQQLTELIIGSQASSLQWVPLVDLLHTNRHLQPRFIRQQSTTKTSTSTSSQNDFSPPTLDPIEIERNNQWNEVRLMYGPIRPDLPYAYNEWNKYYQQLNPIDYNTIINSSHLPTTIPYTSEFGQLITTSIGHTYPIRQSHHEFFLNESLSLYLGEIITQTRNEAFNIIGGQQRIFDFAQIQPVILRDMGLSPTEIGDFMKDNQHLEILLGGFKKPFDEKGIIDPHAVNEDINWDLIDEANDADSE